MISSKEYKVGDTVRFVFTSYYEMLKSDYWQLYSVFDQTDSDMELSLGGIYDIKEIKINKWGVYMFRLLDLDKNKSWEPEANIESIHDTSYCPYDVNQKLIFKPQSKKKDVDSLVSWINEYTVCNDFSLYRKLNNYYIYVKNNKGLIYDHPFLWFDFGLKDKGDK
jgi:hypothetical protein